MEVTKVFNKFVAIFVLAILGGFFLSQPVSAASDISVSNSGKVSFGKVSASSTGTLATGQDTLNITTDCEAGVNVYATSTNGGNTSLINLAAGSNNTIATSSNTISSPSSLENNTWGLNVINNNTYYGLPEYSASGLPTVIYSGTNTELPIYYGAKVTNSLAPGTYTGEVLYTVTVNNSCLDYTVKFNKNANDASGDMSDQAILPTGGTLSENSFTYSGYAFLGWSLDPAGKTGTATNGIGTAEDVDFADKASFPGSNESILPGSETTLYAIWEEKIIYMQDVTSCKSISEGTTGILIDSRDNQEYTIYHFPSNDAPTRMENYCIMTKDLALGYVTGNSITKGTDLVLSADDSADAGTVIARASANEWNNTETDANVQYSTGPTGSLSHGYYSYGAAQKVCPKGWRLPTKSEYNNIASFIGGDTYAGSSIIRGSPYNFNYGGYFDGSGLWSNDSIGYYRASTQNTYSSGDYLHLSDGRLFTSSVNKSWGMSVRCITESADDYMQNFDINTSTLSVGGTTKLMDKRDGSVYSIKKFSDGSVWMTSNLKLGHDKGYILNNELTNISDNDISNYYIPKAGYQGGGLITEDGRNDGYGATFSSNASTDKHAKVQYASASDLLSRSSNLQNPQDTGYYNFYTATLGCSSYTTEDLCASANISRDICPKGWRLPINNTISTRYSWSSLDYSINPSASNVGSNRNDTTSRDSFLNQSSFLYQGYYENSYLYDVGSKGYWWSSNTYNVNTGYGLFLYSSSGNNMSPQYFTTKYYGYSVRCTAIPKYYINYNSNGGTGEMAPSKGYIGSGAILSRNTFTKDNYYFAGWSTNPSATTATYTNGATVPTDLAPAGGSITLYAVWLSTDKAMQNWSGCSTLENGATASLTDLRDGSIYNVKKFANNQCWMTSNLILGYDKGYALTSADTNIPDNTTYYLPPAGKRGSVTNPSTIIATNTATFDGSYESEAHIQYAANSSNLQSTSYYNFNAASLGYSGGSYGATSGRTPRDICPKGWQLPYQWSSFNDFSEFVYGASFGYTGYYQNSSRSGAGEQGWWWSSNVKNSAYSYGLTIYSNGSINASIDQYKYYGLAVRCVAK